jgi:alkaline phosphatase
MKNTIIKSTALFLSLALLSSFSFEDANEVEVKRPRNIILMIGDGMGLAQITAGMTYNKGSLHMERATHVGLVKTHSANQYITDSAASGTAMATGKKTNNGVIGKDTEGAHLKTILEYAEDHGLSTGLVSTSAITHATPASFIAHVDSRSEYDEIASFFLWTDIDVFIGGGRAHFDRRNDSINLIKAFKNKGYQVLYDMRDISRVRSGKLAGLVAKEHTISHLEGRSDMLPASTRTAMRILDNNPEGFFLMVEGSQIDWAGHGHNTYYIMTEVVDFDLAVREAFNFADRNGETLVLVTADHETGGMSILGGNFEKGMVQAKYTTGGHTGIMVPMLAYGPGAELFSGIYDNTEIFDKMMYLYGFEK